MNQILSHRARLVMLAPHLWLQNGVVTTSGRMIVAVEPMGKKGPPGRLVEWGPGILMPSVVNAHTHLTLSALKGKPERSRGFVQWVQSLIEAREGLSMGDALEATREAICALKGEGVGLVGEFGPLFPVEGLLQDSGMEGIVWQEFLGPDRELPLLQSPLPGIVLSYAGHGPHTASPGLLKRLKATCSELGLPFAMHLAESIEEKEFLETGDGPWAVLLRSRGIEFSDWDCFGRTPVQLAVELGLLDEGTLLVHLLQVTSRELELLAESKAKVCLCPRSNLALHRALPDLEEFLRRGLRPALGTDSLASVDSLSMFEEMGVLAKGFPNLDPAVIMEMATINGASALGRSDLGVLEKGRLAKMVYVEVQASGPRAALELLVSGTPLPLSPVGW